MGDPASAFGLYVSSIEGQPVARFGSGGVMIGAERDLNDRRVVRYTPDVVVAISHEEARKYAREYRRAIDDGSLKLRTAAEWATQNPPPAPAATPAPETPKTSTEAGAPLPTSLKADDPPEAPKDHARHAHHESRR